MQRTMKISTLCALLLVTTSVAAQVPQLFVTSDRCMACHNGLVSSAGEDVSIGVGWRSSMMANSSRDPYWQAAVRREALAHPTAAADIQNECSACHMPMMRFQANAEGRKGEIFSHLPLSHGDPLAADGVSCAVCHQIQKEGLGERASFTAGFQLDTATPEGERQVFGPYEVDTGRTSLMRSASRFAPAQGSHVQSSELCATCHTLITHTLDANGAVIGEFPEQVPYLEWQHSSFADVRSCQSCHMPVIEEATSISSVLGVPREAVSRHVFRGGNILMPRILNSHRTELAVVALPQELQTTIQRSEENLQNAAATVSLVETKVEGGTLRTEVVITNLAGHKLPSAYPSRRAWLHFTVWDAVGEMVFESGGLNRDGSIRGNANDVDASRYEAHHLEIDHPEQVQIYEAIMADPDGAVTTVLLSAMTYVKDNRLLPEGFDKTSAEDDVAVHGGAFGDKDFVGGRDRVRYAVDVADAEGPFIVDAELWYQPVGYRWAHNLGDQKAVEIERFISYFEEAADSSAVILASAKAIAE
jgi:hypothetical protein